MEAKNTDTNTELLFGMIRRLPREDRPWVLKMLNQKKGTTTANTTATATATATDGSQWPLDDTDEDEGVHQLKQLVSQIHQRFANTTRPNADAAAGPAAYLAVLMEDGATLRQALGGTADDRAAFAYWKYFNRDGSDPESKMRNLIQFCRSTTEAGHRCGSRRLSEILRHLCISLASIRKHFTLVSGARSRHHSRDYGLEPRTPWLRAALVRHDMSPLLGEYHAKNSSAQMGYVLWDTQKCPHRYERCTCVIEGRDARHRTQRQPTKMLREIVEGDHVWFMAAVQEMTMGNRLYIPKFYEYFHETVSIEMWRAYLMLHDNGATINFHNILITDPLLREKILPQIMAWDRHYLFKCPLFQPDNGAEKRRREIDTHGSNGLHIRYVYHYPMVDPALQWRKMLDQEEDTILLRKFILPLLSRLDKRHLVRRLILSGFSLRLVHVLNTIHVPWRDMVRTVFRKNPPMMYRPMVFNELALNELYGFDWLPPNIASRREEVREQMRERERRYR